MVLVRAFGPYPASLFKAIFKAYRRNDALAGAKRLTSSDILTFYTCPLTNAEFRFIIGEQLQEIGIDPGQF